MNVAVIGVGAFGRNHARVYQELAKQNNPVRLVGVVDRDVSRADTVAREFACRGFGSIDQLLSTHSEVQAASIAVPTAEHFAIAETLMQSGIDVLIEKPVTTSVTQADELIALAKKLDRVAQVGHVERFNPAVRATLPIVTTPMFFEVHRLSVFTSRSLDVDVVLDLMIHDLDVVLSFVKSEVRDIQAVGLPILSGKVDIANVRLEFESGCVANLTASRVSTERVRKLRFFQPQQYISLDYARQDVLVFGIDGKEKSLGTPSTNPQINVVKPEIVPEEPLHAELRSFLECVRKKSNPVVSLEEGRKALAVALDVVSAIQRHSERANLKRLHAK